MTYGLVTVHGILRCSEDLLWRRASSPARSRRQAGSQVLLTAVSFRRCTVPGDSSRKRDGDSLLVTRPGWGAKALLTPAPVSPRISVSTIPLGKMSSVTEDSVPQATCDSVFVLRGCRNKWPQAGCLETTDSRPFAVWRPGVQTRGAGGPGLLQEALRKRFLSPPAGGWPCSPLRVSVCLCASFSLPVRSQLLGEGPR